MRPTVVPMSALDTVSVDAVGRFGMLAQAVSAQPLDVAAADDSATYTDGKTIYVDSGSSWADARDAVAVQAALIAGGSITRDILQQLSRQRQPVVARYLSLEVGRLAEELTTVLPLSTIARLRREVPKAAVKSSRDSLRLARGTEQVPAIPPWVGTLDVGRLLRAETLQAAPAPASAEARRDVDGPDVEAADDDEGFGEPSRIRRLFASPLSNPLADAFRNVFGTSSSSKADVGGGGALSMGGQRSAPRGPKAIVTRVVRTIDAVMNPPPVGGVRYPEWDANARGYRTDWCAVTEYNPPEGRESASSGLGGGSLRRPLARVGMEPQRHRRQSDGDTLDMSAVVDYVANRRLGENPEPNIFERTRSTKRDLSVLVLLDASGSTSELSGGGSVFSEERRLAGDLTASLDSLGDHVANYGFFSRGRECLFVRVKTFSDRFDSAARRRLFAVEPTGFTRLGVAIRHGTHLLQTQARAANMVLVVVGDGLPYDDGYENEYARSDTRQAISEAVLSGVGVVGVAIRSSVEPRIHEDIWSQVPFRVVGDVKDASRHLRPLILDALRITRGNGRRREISSASGRSEVRESLARGRRLNSYV